MKRNRYEVSTRKRDGKDGTGYAVTRTKYDPMMLSERWKIFDAMEQSGETERIVKAQHTNEFVYVYRITTEPQAQEVTQ